MSRWIRHTVYTRKPVVPVGQKKSQKKKQKTTTTKILGKNVGKNVGKKSRSNVKRKKVPVECSSDRFLLAVNCGITDGQTDERTE